MNRILAGSLIIFIVCWSGLCLGSETQDSKHEPQISQDQTGETKRVTKELGPFEIGKKRFVVIQDETEREGDIISYNSFEIQDEAGVSHFKEELGFVPGYSTAIEGIFKLRGKNGEGLIIFFDTWPTAPPAGKSFQIFGLEKGKIKALSPPISVYGNIEQLPKEESKEVLELFAGDLIKVEVWRDWFGVYIPLAVDLQKLTITTFKTQGIYDIYMASTPNQPYTYNSIEFYHDHNIKSKVKKIVAATIKKVEFLNVYADVQLKKQGRDLEINVSNLWLKIKINGQEGWVKSEDDFNALGLFQN